MSDLLLAKYDNKRLILIGLVANHELHSPSWFLALMCRAELMRRKPATKENS